MTPHYSFLLFVLHFYLALLKMLTFWCYYRKICLRFPVIFGALSQHTPLCTDLATKVGQGYSRGTESKS